MSKGKKRFFRKTTEWQRQIDYADKLTSEELEFLDQFNDEFDGMNINGIEKKRRTKAEKSNYYRKEKAKRNDIMNAKSHFSTELTEQTQIASVEDTLIDAIDLISKAKDELYRCPECESQALAPFNQADTHPVGVTHRLCRQCGYKEFHNQTLQRKLEKKQIN